MNKKKITKKRSHLGFFVITLEIAKTYYNDERFCEWQQDGELHREDDHPAVIYQDGSRFWYLHGDEIHAEFADDELS